MKRWCGGEGQWKTNFVNESKEPAIIGLTPNRPGKVGGLESRRHFCCIASSMNAHLFCFYNMPLCFA
jgi:hypothetical protein